MVTGLHLYHQRDSVPWKRSSSLRQMADSSCIWCLHATAGCLCCCLSGVPENLNTLSAAYTTGQDVVLSAVIVSCTCCSVPESACIAMSQVLPAMHTRTQGPCHSELRGAT